MTINVTLLVLNKTHFCMEAFKKPIQRLGISSSCFYFDGELTTGSKPLLLSVKFSILYALVKTIS